MTVNGVEAQLSGNEAERKTSLGKEANLSIGRLARLESNQEFDIQSTMEELGASWAYRTLWKDQAFVHRSRKDRGQIDVDSRLELHARLYKAGQLAGFRRATLGILK